MKQTTQKIYYWAAYLWPTKYQIHYTVTKNERNSHYALYYSKQTNIQFEEICSSKKKNTTQQTFVVLQILLQSKTELNENVLVLIIQPIFLITQPISRNCNSAQLTSQKQIFDGGLHQNHSIGWARSWHIKPLTQTEQCLKGPQSHSVYTFREVTLGVVSVYYAGIVESMLTEKNVHTAKLQQSLIIIT